MVSAAADRARAAGKENNSAGPECAFGNDSADQSYQDARCAVDEAQQFHFDDMCNDDQLDKARSQATRPAIAKLAVTKLKKAMAEQSEFQKEAFGKGQAKLLDELKKDANERKDFLDHGFPLPIRNARETGRGKQRAKLQKPRNVKQKKQLAVPNKKLRRPPDARNRKPSKRHPPTKHRLPRCPATRWTTTPVAAPTEATTQ